MRRVLFLLLILLVYAVNCSDQGIPPEVKKFIGKYIHKTPPKIDNRVNANFDNQITFIGYNLRSKIVRANTGFEISLFFRALKPVDKDYKIFVHLHSVGGMSRYLNFDHDPVDGYYKTSYWKSTDEIVEDLVFAKIPKDFPNGKAVLYVGFYTGEQRLPLVNRNTVENDGNNRALVTRLDIVEGKSLKKMVYQADYITEKFELDGKLDKPVWQKAKKTDLFSHPGGSGQAVEETWAKFLWDSENLYIAFYCKDKDIVNKFKDRDDHLYQFNEVVEVFLDPSRKRKNYYEFQVSPGNIQFDAFFETRRNNTLRLSKDRKKNAELQLKKAMDWNSTLKSAVYIEGTLNNDKDSDKFWSVEMAIPFKDILFAPHTPPKSGDKWAVNLFRLDNSKKKMEASAWSPPLIGDFHNLTRFGTLLFAKAETEKEKGPEKGTDEEESETGKEKVPPPKEKGKVIEKKGAEKPPEKPKK